MSDADGLLQDILAHPEDDAPRLVYADWLDDHREPDHAEFIRVQIEAARLRQGKAFRPALHERERELLGRHRDEWLREVPAPLRRGAVFERGFVGGLNCSALEFLRGAERLFRSAPVRSARLDYATRRLADLAACPQLARLRRISFRGAGNRLDGTGASAFFASPHLGGLVELDLNGNVIGPQGAVALAGCPLLAGLAQLDLSNNHVGDEGAASLAASPHLGNLEHLTLYQNDVGDAGTAALAAAPHLNRLDFLSLISNQVGPAGAEALAAAPGLPALSRLRLAFNPVGDRGATALLAAPRLARLRELDLRYANVSPETAAALRQRFTETLYV
ncbi:MAG TPA: TIGR02996 domain-containing protein [Gemmataceae bacterium]|nr:TIGR02996 domain-containing protein [Gemmataceae bacterium]